MKATSLSIIFVAGATPQQAHDSDNDSTSRSNANTSIVGYVGYKTGIVVAGVLRINNFQIPTMLLVTRRIAFGTVVER